MRFWVIACALAGCNQVFGLDSTQVRETVDADMRPDRDEDGIADVEDPCISPAEEATSDVDGDGVPDRADRCPFSLGPGTDSDNDGTPDICDPYFNMGGDRHRCTMTFQNRTLNAAPWARRPRPTADPMELIPLTGLLVVFGSGEGVAIEDILGSAATIVVDVPIGVSYSHEDFVVGALIGAQPVPQTSDVTCEIAGKGGTITVSLAGQTRVTSTPGPLPRIRDVATEGAAFDVRVYLQPTRAGSNITCVLFYVDVNDTPRALTAKGRIDPPIGKFGLFGQNGFYSFFGLEIFERDDMPMLP